MEFEFPFSGSLTSTFLVRFSRLSIAGGLQRLRPGCLLRTTICRSPPVPCSRANIAHTPRPRSASLPLRSTRSPLSIEYGQLSAGIPGSQEARPQGKVVMSLAAAASFYGGRSRTPHPTPYTLHPTPHAPYPTPHTTHPTLHTPHHTLRHMPQTLPPVTYNLHPTPYNLHSTPFTLNPTPFTLHTSHYTLHTSYYTLNSSLTSIHSSKLAVV